MLATVHLSFTVVLALPVSTPALPVSLPSIIMLSHDGATSHRLPVACIPTISTTLLIGQVAGRVNVTFVALFA